MTLILICGCLESTIAQTAIHQRQVQNKKPPKYRIAYRYRTKSTPSILIIHISVHPKHFNRDDMEALARQLDKDFRREQLVTFVICDDYVTAKNPGIIYDLLRREPPPALRGFYEINRASDKKSIGYSTERGKPRDEISIDLSGRP